MTRPRRARLAAALAFAAAATGAAAMTTQPLTAAQKALVAHYTNNDPEWAVLRQAKVGEDRARGLLTAEFPASIKALAGRPLRISGFMSPLETGADTRHFIVTRRSTTCPFCPPNAATEAVEVRLDRPVQRTDEEVVVVGRLSLVATSDEGLFYALGGASLQPSHRS